MKFNNDDKYNELLHWLAYNFPGTYRIWTDKQNNQDLFNRNRLYRDKP